jgi:hypothetical protein
MAIREGKWDCSFCGQKGIRGPVLKCTGCGSPRGDDVELYLEDNAAEVTDEEELKQAKIGPDWSCGYCGTSNKSGSTRCSSCGAGSDGSKPRSTESIMDQQLSVQSPVRSEAKVQKGSKRTILAIVLGVIGIIVFCLYFFVFRTHVETFEIATLNWERTIQVEKKKWVTESNWADQLPAGIREISRQREIFKKKKIQVGTKKVKVGKKDLGNGYFEDIYEDRPVYKEEPVYKMKVRYQIERWKPERKLSAKGSNDDIPDWPKLNLMVKEREGKRFESYKLILRTPKGEEKEWITSDQDKWGRFDPGMEVQAQVRASGAITDVFLPGQAPLN